MADKKKGILDFFSKSTRPVSERCELPKQPEMPVILEREYDLAGVQIFTEDVRFNLK